MQTQRKLPAVLVLLSDDASEAEILPVRATAKRIAWARALLSGDNSEIARQLFAAAGN